MTELARANNGMVVAPHHLAAEAGCEILREGGNAIEAMVAAAAAITIAYPHMNALGGDNFWLISKAGEPPVGIDAAGPSASLADADFYRDTGHDAIPGRGPAAALTVAGAVAGIAEALAVSAEWGGRMPLARLLEGATGLARDGIPVPETLHANATTKRPELESVAGFADTFLPEGAPPEKGAMFSQPRLASTFDHLASAGLDDFYRGDLARSMAADLEAAGSPLRLRDLESYRALRLDPLSVQLEHARVYNMPPPTQGLASLMILGIFERLGVTEAETFDYVHGLIESTKQAFLVRDAHVCDPAYMQADPKAFLDAASLDERAAAIDREKALPWPQPAKPGDTVWLGAIDGQGNAVSFIQSLYWEFGSGLVLPDSGLLWQNRGTSFSLDEKAVNALKPGRRPFHTIQPPLALFKDGRVMPYGTMGGEGQPQTQSMIYTRYALYGQDLAKAIAAPRWLLGRTWGAETTNLRVENRLEPSVIEALRAAGHDVEVVGPFDEVMGHAGALVRGTDGTIEGASDPRSDGAAVGC
ncbi:MAG: gamma-glutamyltransferase family protein [Hyphomicrobiaceae bacterium]|nr:gamma-glutamyltransferase family protein [Hyphomicrobiaceae bacterium]